MLFGNANIENPTWKTGLDLVKTGTRWHRRRNRHNLWINFSSSDQAIGKNRCIAWQIATRFLLRAGDNIELGNSMIFFCRWSRKRMPMSFFSNNMNQYRPMRSRVPKIFQNRQQMRHIMPVNWSDMGKAKLAENRICTHQVARGIFGSPRRPFDFCRKMTGNFAHQITDRMIRLRGNKP